MLEWGGVSCYTCAILSDRGGMREALHCLMRDRHKAKRFQEVIR